MNPKTSLTLLAKCSECERMWAKCSTQIRNHRLNELTAWKNMPKDLVEEWREAQWCASVPRMSRHDVERSCAVHRTSKRKSVSNYIEVLYRNMGIPHGAVSNLLEEMRLPIAVRWRCGANHHLQMPNTRIPKWWLACGAGGPLPCGCEVCGVTR